MITELVVKAALQAVIGQGFKAVVERVFSQSGGKSDRQILEAVLLEVHRHGGQIGNIEMRLGQLEFEVARIQNVPISLAYPSSAQSSELALPPRHAFETGDYFKRVSGGLHELP